MSKIEEALKKARLVEGTTAAPTASSPFQNRSEPAGPKQIRRMGEGWRREPADLAERRIIHPEMADKQVLNAFRELRTTVVQRTSGRAAVVLVTATAGHGGGSFVALNLGAAIALDESHTAVVVDCNFAEPGVQRLLEDPGAPGLADYLLAEDLAPEAIIHRCGIPRLRVVPVGRGDGQRAELFTLARMRQLMSSLRTRYPDRYVVVDAPPLAEAADVRLLLELCDHALLVVPYGRNTESEVEAAVAAMPAQKLIGVVFNDEPRSSVVAA